MELSRDSRIVRWAYLTEKHKIPERTSLCVIFWRSVLGTPIVLLGLFVWLPTIVLLAVYKLALLIWAHKGETLMVLGGIAALAIAIAAIVIAKRAVERARNYVGEPTAAHVLVSGAMAVKQRICPIVTIKESSDVGNG